MLDNMTMNSTMNLETFSLEGRKVSYFLAGQGKPLVISNAMGIHPSFWEPFIQLNKNKFKIFLVNNRDTWYGDDLEDDDKSVSDHYSEDLAAVINHNDLKNYLLLGYCSGCLPMSKALNLVHAPPLKAIYLSSVFDQKVDLKAQMFKNLIDRRIGSGKSLHAIRHIAMNRCHEDFQEEMENLLLDEKKLKTFLRYLIDLNFTPLLSDKVDPGNSIIVNAENDIDGVKLSNGELLNDNKLSDIVKTIPALGHFAAFESPSYFSEVFSKIVNNEWSQ